jgi:hypothetical protein
MAATTTERDAPRDTVGDGLEDWLDRDEATTLGSLNEAFGEKVVATACLALMAPSALPIPTGGATHVFEVVAAIFAAQMVIGREEIWLPEKWQTKELGPKTQKGLRGLIRFVRFCERFSRPRLASVIDSRIAQRLLGLVIVAFIIGAAVAPPFSGLDTLPSLGVVLVALAILLEDAAFAIAGLVVGIVGITLTIFLGAEAAQFVTDHL